MNNEANKPPQSSLYLRLLGGGYLVYLAWDLRGAVQDNPLFWLAILVFGGVGAVLLVHALVKLLRREYTTPNDSAETEINEDCEEQTHE